MEVIVTFAGGGTACFVSHSPEELDNILSYCVRQYPGLTYLIRELP